MKRKRKNYLSEEKAVILKRHLIDKLPVSNLCDGYSLQGSKKRSVFLWLLAIFGRGGCRVTCIPTATE